MLELLGSPAAQACWSRPVLHPLMTLRVYQFLDLGWGSLIRRPSFSSGGFVAACARAARSDAHHGSLAGSEGLSLPDWVTVPAS
ncbi:hypothetical protein SLEP1_g47550 [Rubroshorea leprosula]|uniref:Uncharacterized protein n=1 Tax=Rubroshorea leprosula TaxID=152421 RepID=A0AAV5LT18_9ROSI|nr:hypothetical protein SLEP1_g47550 [Rubroshorea leprosula]